MLDLGDGVYAVFAHLRRRSVRVTAGQRVTTGQPLAECANSGNTTEPHLHFQLMDHPNVLLAAGVPVLFQPGGSGPALVPRTGEHLLAGQPPAPPAGREEASEANTTMELR